MNKNTKEKFILAILADITEKVILQKELAAEHDLLTAFLKHCTDLVYFKDLQSRFIKVGKVFAEQHNLTPEMMVGKTDFDLWGPEHAVQAYNDEQEIIRTGKAIIGKEEKEDWQDGRITWVSSSKMPFYDNNSQIIGTFGISRNITESKIAEEEKNNNFIFEKMVSKVSSIFIRHGSAYFNRALRIVLQELSEFVKCSRSYVYYINGKESILEKEEEYPNKTKLHPDYYHMQNFVNWNKKLENSEIVFDLLTELTNDCYLNEVKYLESNKLSHIIIIPLTNYSGLVGFVSFECNDLSMIWLKRNKDLFIIIGEIVSNSFSNYIAEKYRLEAEEEMFKLLRAVDQSTNIIIIMDKNGYMEYVNSKFSEHTGYLFQEIIGTRPHFLDPEINSQFDLTSLWQEIEKGNPWEGKFQDVSKSGKTFWAHISISPIKSIKREITNILAIVEDITEKIVIEGQNAMSQKLESIGQLAA